MKLSEYAMIGLFVVVVTVLAWGWRQEGIKTALAEQEAAQLRASITDSIRVLDSLRLQFEQDRTQFGNDTLRLHGLLQNARVTIRTLRQSGDSLTVVLASDTTPSDSIRTLTNLAATRLAEAVECGVALDSTQSVLGACSGLLARADTLLDQERGVRRQTEALAETYRKMAHPSLFTRIGKGLPYLGAGIVVGLILK